jgi:type VI secretion system ImpA family protein
MAVSLDDLLAPVSEEDLVGPDLSYDAGRQEIETAFETSASGDASNDGDVDWRQIIGLIEAQSAVTKDVWLAVYLMRAGAKAGRLDTVETGAGFLAGMLEAWWDVVHPTLDEYGYQGRKGPCEALTRIGEFILPLRRVILLEHPRLGAYSGIDFDRFRDNGDSEDGYGMFRAAIEETSDEELQVVIDRLDHIRDGIRRADAVLTENSGNDTGTNFQPTYEVLDQIRRGVAAHLRVPDETADEESGDADFGSGAEAGGGRVSGRIESREDVFRAMDLIADYYARKEPGSPVPIALRRAREWVSMDFLAVLQDIAPNSMEEARRVLTSQPRDSYYESTE